MRKAAIYARVSTPRQGREQTIESQLALLKSWAVENGHDLSPENVFTDEGYSGSRLDRPGLDALRDGSEDGAFEVVGGFEPGPPGAQVRLPGATARGVGALGLRGRLRRSPHL
jgi:hypothetical protein